MATIAVQGSGAAAATTVTIPAHAAGDKIVIIARGGATIPSLPTAGGTVPTFTTPTNQSGVNNSISLRVGVADATASNHTSGTWTNATQLHVLVLRPSAGGTLAAGNSPAQGGANNVQNIVYPALTRTAGTDDRLAIRYGARGTADTEVRTSGGFSTGGTFRTELPATTPTSAVFTKTITGNEASFTAATAGTNAAYRAGSLEIVAVASKSIAANKLEVANPTAVPLTRTDHKLVLNNARVMATASGIVTRLQLMEGVTNIGPQLSTAALTTTPTRLTVSIADADAASITDYSNLYFAVYANSPNGDAVEVRITDAWLDIPAPAIPTPTSAPLRRRVIRLGAVHRSYRW